MRALSRGLLCVLLLCAFARPVAAASIEKLIMPGPVTQAHARLEAECGKCHDRTNRAAQSTLCRDCHREIDGDIRSGTRYHGRMPAAEGQCRGCHTEHRGRDADINRLSRSGFNHALSVFPLQGAHQNLSCSSCHRPGAAYRKASTSCLDCHRDRDVHLGNLGKDCASCHDAAGWETGRFDHDATHFPLTNRHRELGCPACHAGERYRGTPDACIACHQPDDVHRGAQGSRCAECHSTASWTSQRFDHERESGFALRGAHGHVPCGGCHRSGDVHAPVSRECAGCHGSDDRHAGRMGAACADCHGNDVWKVPQFDHAGRFGYALQGAHLRLDCQACHTALASEQQLGRQCIDCHRAADSHQGQLGRQCEQCHGQTRWQEVRFDHDLSSYPLTGLHVIVSCAQCHTSQRFSAAPRDCHGCHSADDAHQGALGTDCAACHSANGWQQWSFEHAARTRFPLLGAHARVGCPDCHIRPQNRLKPSMICGSCHAADDIHQGRFGSNCQQCHNSASFRRPRTG